MAYRGPTPILKGPGRSAGGADPPGCSMMERGEIKQIAKDHLPPESFQADPCINHVFPLITVIAPKMAEPRLGPECELRCIGPSTGSVL